MAARRRPPLAAQALALLVCAAHGVAASAEPAAPSRHVVEQPAQALADALRSIARQTGASVLFDPGVVDGKTARAVSGRLSAAEAITRALDGSGLAAEVMPDGAIVVKPAAAPAGVPPASAEKIEVTGSRLKRIATEGPVPVNTYTAKDIQNSGQPTLERFLAGLNEASMAPGEGAQGGTTGQGSVQLRGLPVGSTLVLINGRRVQAVGSSSANFFNLSLIPLAAVERVEIVPVGSSAIYGGDALAGVVNIILKKSIDGLSLNARLGAGQGLSDGSLSLATGGQTERGSYLLLGSYSKSTPLTMTERGFFRDGDYRRFGGPDTRTRSCTPGTVSSASGDNLPGLGSPLAGIPRGTAGLGVDDFIATAGQPELCNSLANGNGYALVHGEESLSLHAVADWRLSDAWSAFGELTHARDRVRAEQTGLALNNVLVPATNPYNPFGVPVRVTSRLGLDNGAEGLARDTDYTRALLGLRGELLAGWDLEATLSTSRDDGERRLLNGSLNTAALNAALAAAAPDAALDPFTTGLAASPEVLRAIWSDNVRQNHGRKDAAAAFVRGPVLALPAGPVDTVLGVEFTRDRYETSLPGASITDRRSARALYGEFRVPLLRADAPAGGGWSLATLTLAGRRDHYSDFGSAGTYQAGVELRPVRTVLLRAATATSFKPPTLLQTSVDDTSIPAEAFGLVDPARGGEPITGAGVLRTTNPDLQPEKGRAWSLGAVWEPDAGLGTRLGFTLWRVEIDGLISLLWPQVTLDNESRFPGLVTRGPSVGGQPGPVTGVRYSEVNFGSLETAGADVDAAYAWRAAGGRWSIAASATRTTQYEVAIAPGAPAQDRLGQRALDYWAPKWKGRLSAGLDAGAWSLGLTSRYLGAYRDEGADGRRLGDYWMHDLSGRLDLKRLGLGLPGAKAVVVSLAVTNLGDRQPEFVATAPYYDVTQADWRGRYASLRLAVDW
ncbi:MAG: TonB-dependent receptor [Rubrivivax sp.]